jgi:hypothetical protein
MNGTFRMRCGALAGALTLASTAVAEAQPAVSVTAFNPARFQLFCPNAITQNFPTTGPAETTWLICWREVAGNNSIVNPNAWSSVRSICAKLRTHPSFVFCGTCGCPTTSCPIIPEAHASMI